MRYSDSNRLSESLVLFAQKSIRPDNSVYPEERLRNRGTLAPWQRKRVVEFIDGNLASDIRVDDLARIARLSSSHFAAVFKAAFNQSPYQYVLKCRMRLAKELLRLTDLSLCDIALDCGLADQAHLCRLFRRHFGLTPKNWRTAGRLASVQVKASAAVLCPAL